jgi:hypothetical protein
LIVSSATKDADGYSWDKGIGTTPSTGTQVGNCVLLINSYKDASPSIDEIHYKVLFAGTPGLPLCPEGDGMMKIVDSGGAYFYEKIYKALSVLQLSGLEGSCFYLKIDFVGRYPDDSIGTIDGSIIKFSVSDFTANFDFKGAEYHLKIHPLPFGATSSNDRHSSIGRNLCVKSTTIGGAFKDLETKLNNSIKKDLTEAKLIDKTRIIKYEFDAGQFGGYPINSIIKHETLNQNDTPIPSRSNPGNNGKDVYINFAPTVKINAALSAILRLSPKFNTYIAQSRQSVHKTGQPGAKLFKIVDSVESTNGGEIKYTFKVHDYIGKESTDYTFYYYYSGKNVDVISFDMKFGLAQSYYILSHNRNNDSNTGQSGAANQETNQYKNDNIDPSDPERDQNTVGQSYKSNDPGAGATVMHDDVQALITQVEDEAKDFRAARETVATGGSSAAGSIQFNAKIRGNPLFLDINNKPDGIGFTAPLIVKMIIKNADGTEYWYKGNYQVMYITNVISGGMFTQDLTGWVKP